MKGQIRVTEKENGGYQVFEVRMRMRTPAHWPLLGRNLHLRGGKANRTGCGVWRAMASSWHGEVDDYKARSSGRGLAGSRPRFSYTEVKMLLEEVRRNRYILLRKFNHGVTAEAKKQKWAEITDQINGLGQNHREVRQIMKKWADLKCDGKRRMALLCAHAGSVGRRKRKSLDSVEKMVQGILLMSPTADALGEADEWDEVEWEPEPKPKRERERERDTPESKPTAGYPYPDARDGSLLGGLNLDFSPLSSPDKETSGDPFHSSEEDADPPSERDEKSPSAVPPEGGEYARPAPHSADEEDDDDNSSSSPSLSRSRGPSPLPSGGLAQLARRSVRQQRAGRHLLASVSRSLGALARSLRVLADGQRDFVRQSLTLQRETLGVLKGFSAAALTALRDGAERRRTLAKDSDAPPADPL
ncbi:uncharacterized protein LOC144083171 isoform X2 [Stigmatopora argus]